MSRRDNLKAEEGLIGQVVNDRFRIEALLGRGNIGVVYRATDMRESRQVAFKIIKYDLAEKGLQESFNRDAQMVAKINHPNALRILEYGSLSTGGGFFAMEFVDGRTLRDLLKERKKLSIDQAIDILKQICSPLAVAHKIGVLHRDLKPENVILPAAEGEKKVIVADFGLAKLKEGVQQSKANLTAAGEVMGTPSYMAPEQCLEAGVDERSDIYALGIIFFEMLAGKPPFEGNFFTVLQMHMGKPVPSVKDFNPDVPAPVENFIKELLTKEKEKRPATIEEVVQKIGVMEKAISGSPAAAAPTAAPVVQSVAAVAPAQSSNIATAAPPAKPANVTPASTAVEQPKNNTMLVVVVVVILIGLLAVGYFALK